MTQQPHAKYCITDRFKITGRGLVFTGNLTEGEVLSGDIMEFTAFNTVFHRKITGVEFHRKPGPDQSSVSLLIRCENENEIDRLRNWEFNNQIALIYKTETPDMNLIAAHSHLPKPERTWWRKVFNLK